MAAEDPKERLEYHLRMEALLLQVAQRFLALRSEQAVEDAIAATLEQVARFVGADRCYLYLIDRERGLARRTHIWSHEGLPDLPVGDELDLTALDGAIDPLIEGGPVVIDDARAFHARAAFRAVLDRFRISALLAAPMTGTAGVEGFLGMSMVDGPRAWTDEETTLVQFLGLAFAEALRRQRDENALRRSEARFVGFLEQNPDAMYVLEVEPPLSTDAPVETQVDAILDAEIVLCNRPGAAYFGHDEREILGMTFSGAFAGTDPQLIAILREDTRTFIAGEYKIHIDETPWKMPDGRDAWVARSAHGVVVRGKLTSVWATARDITAEKRARDERTLMAKRLEQAERLEGIGLLAGGVAHDFNNLLLAILGNADLASLHVGDAEMVKESLGEIRRAGQRAAELTRQLLAFSRSQPTAKKPLDLNDLIGSITRMLARLLPESIGLDFIPGHDLGTVLADEAQIEQMLLNLSINARDAMTEGGRLTLETQNVRINGEYCRTHPWAKPGRYVLLTVADTGHGISDEELEHIFEPFYTTKGPGHGTGLGLASVYGIVQQHGGQIQVYSEVGVGTTFKVYLPIAEQEALRVGSEVRPAPPTGDETVLLAEDEEQVRTVATRILERAGYTVVAVADGTQAVEAFAAETGRFDIVMLDVVMPAMNGREARARIHAMRPDVPIVFSSGYTGSVLDGVDLEALDAPLLAKPYDPDELLVALRKALDGHPTTREG